MQTTRQKSESGHHAILALHSLRSGLSNQDDRTSRCNSASEDSSPPHCAGRPPANQIDHPDSSVYATIHVPSAARQDCGVPAPDLDHRHQCRTEQRREITSKSSRVLITACRQRQRPPAGQSQDHPGCGEDQNVGTKSRCDHRGETDRQIAIAKSGGPDRSKARCRLRQLKLGRR